MIDSCVKGLLGFPEDTEDKVVQKLWKDRVSRVCKPCWDLKYCPYGPLVEQFPAYPLLREDVEGEIAQAEEARYRLEHENIKDKKLKKSLKISASFNPEEYPIALPKVVEESFCQIFGHICPVFYVAEPFTETSEGRCISPKIPRVTMFKVVRRDNNQCQLCGKLLKDEEIEFDHVIPKSKGGSSDIQNIRVLCLECNRKKSDKIEL